MRNFRILPLGVNDAATNMAVDESVLLNFIEGNSPVTLRFYRWEPSAISIGRFQSLEFEVDMESVSEFGVEIVRRITGGGAVFHDSAGELTYSFVAPESMVSGDVVKTFSRICSALVRGIQRLGLDAEYKSVNDVIVNGRKISGSAQTRRGGAVLQHGTILVDPDVRRMFRLLKVPKEKITDKFISSAYERVTSLKKELGNTPDFREIRKKMIEGFEEEFSVGFEGGKLNDLELKLVENLREKYKSMDWIGRR